MVLINILQVLEMIKDYHVKSFYDNELDVSGYEIENKNEELSAIILTSENNEVNFYVTGAYNSGVDWLEIDLDVLDELKMITKTIVELEGEIHDKDGLVKELENTELHDLVRIKKEPALSEMKKQLTIVGDRVVYSKTGEFLEGIEIIEQEPSFNIKIK